MKDVVKLEPKKPTSFLGGNKMTIGNLDLMQSKLPYNTHKDKGKPIL